MHLIGLSRNVRFSGIITTKSTFSRSFSNFLIPRDDEALSKIEDDLKSKKILYFTATWCPPCKAIAPVFEKLAKAHPSTQFVKIDIDYFQDVAQRYSIRSVPTFCFINGTLMINQFSGANEDTLKENIKSLENS